MLNTVLGVLYAFTYLIIAVLELFIISLLWLRKLSHGKTELLTLNKVSVGAEFETSRIALSSVS